MPERKTAVRIIAAGLLIGAPVVLTGCSQNRLTNTPDTNRLVIPTPTTPGLIFEQGTDETGIRKEIGSWSRVDVEKLANGMMADSRFPIISHAGEILKGNAGGNKIISTETSLFSDDRIRIETVKNFQTEYPNIKVPMDARISQNPPIIIANFKSKRGGKDLNIETGTSLKLDRIRINGEFIVGKSDFMFYLLTAKEVYNIKAFDIVTSTIGNQVFSEFEIPNNQAIRNAVRTGFIKWKTEGNVSAAEVGDLLAHFLILPDYNLAKDLNIISQTEQANGAFWTLNQATDMLTREGVFGKNPEGRYEWKGDADTINSALFRIAWAGVRAGVMSGN